MAHVKIGLIGGSGLGQAISADSATRHDVETPFGRPSDSILETTWSGMPILFLSRHGPGHTRSPSAVPYRANIFALKQLGCTHILASGAVGSLREELRPRQLVIADQVIDKTYRRANTFYENAAVHVEFAEPFCPVLRQILLECSGLGAQRSGSTAAGSSFTEPGALSPEPFVVHPRGCYVTMEGPAFSSRAESLMHRLWGGDLIGMTAMPEAKLAKEAEIPYALIALVTDYDCWKPHAAKEGTVHDPALLLNEILGNLAAASDSAVALLRRAVETIAQNPARLDACPAASALKLAIWSDKSKISPDEIARLAPLWSKYFQT